MLACGTPHTMAQHSTAVSKCYQPLLAYVPAHTSCHTLINRRRCLQDERRLEVGLLLKAKQLASEFHTGAIQTSKMVAFWYTTPLSARH